jgi:hypothetical protein
MSLFFCLREMPLACRVIGRAFYALVSIRGNSGEKNRNDGFLVLPGEALTGCGQSGEVSAMPFNPKQLKFPLQLLEALLLVRRLLGLPRCDIRDDFGDWLWDSDRFPAAALILGGALASSAGVVASGRALLGIRLRCRWIWRLGR